MYRLVLYILLTYVSATIAESFFGILPFSPISIFVSTVVFIFTCYISNKILSKIFKAQANVESSYITALILTLIVTPAVNPRDLFFIVLISVIAISSKYIISFRSKHIFNPAAIAVVISALLLSHPASWWIGTASLFPFVIIGGILIVRKLRFENLVFSFLFVILVLTLVFTVLNGGNTLTVLNQIILYSSIIFMGTIMITEPQTLPPTKTLRNIYGGIVGLLSVPYVHVGSFYFSPEIAISIGNIFSFLVSPKIKQALILKDKIQLSKNVWEFIFRPNSKFGFSPGQYMEWTLSHTNTDSRGNRRFFTIASSPTESDIRLGVKFEESGSSFKSALKNLPINSKIVTAQLAGGFILPKDKNKKITFIAGGIGVTPFRSIIKYLFDKNEKRNIIFFYTNSEESEIAYKELFDQAQKVLGIKIFYVLTNKDKIGGGWQGIIGRIDEKILEGLIPDYNERIYYISGSKPLVDGVKQTLKSIGISRRQIMTDYFPGYA